MNTKFSIAMQGSYPIRDYIDKARRIEAYDFDEVHVYDDLMFKPTWPLLTLIGEHTERIKVGPAIITPEDVIPQIEAMISAGVDHVCFGHPLGPDFNEALELLGNEILPHFRS